MYVDPAAVNERLARLRRWARKAERGSAKPKHWAARERWRQLRESGCKISCCAKPLHKACTRCPRRQAQDQLAPLPQELDARRAS